MKVTEEQAKNINTINDALRLRTHRTFCISGIFILIFVIVIASIVGGLVAKSLHVAEVSDGLEEALIDIAKLSGSLEKALRENTIQGKELRKIKADIGDLKVVISNQGKVNTLISKVENIAQTANDIYSHTSYTHNKASDIYTKVNNIYTKVANIENTQTPHVSKLNTIDRKVDNIAYDVKAIKNKYHPSG